MLDTLAFRQTQTKKNVTETEVNVQQRYLVQYENIMFNNSEKYT